MKSHDFDCHLWHMCHHHSHFFIYKSLRTPWVLIRTSKEICYVSYPQHLDSKRLELSRFYTVKGPKQHLWPNLLRTWNSQTILVDVNVASSPSSPQIMFCWLLLVAIWANICKCCKAWPCLNWRANEQAVGCWALASLYNPRDSITF